MGASQSNLSDPKYVDPKSPYDIVVAVTQAGINATLKQLLAGLDAPEVTICYVYDKQSNLVPIDYESFKTNAKRSDPFSVPDGTDPKNQDLINLSDAYFAGAVKAQLGLPDGLLPSKIPPIATLGSGSDAPVLFNLLCAKFQITGFHYGPRGKTWINQSQSSDQPWYFSANVKLNQKTIDQNSSVPQAVQQRIIELQKDPNYAFTIQKLFLDLATAVLASSPKIERIPEGWPVWSLINSVFMGSYFNQLRQNGDPVLNYHFTVAAPKPATLQLGSVARECLSLKQNGNDIPSPTPEQLNATQLIYIGSTSTTPPIPVPFAWNWIELNEVSQFSGVMAVRRDVFFNFLAEMLNEQIATICIDTTVELTHSGEDFAYKYTLPPSSKPESFRAVSNIQPPDADGFITLLAINFEHTSRGDENTSTHAAEIWSDFNYRLTGTMAVSRNQIRIKIQAQLYMSFGHREVLISYTELEGKNYYDKTITLTYQIGADQSGQLKIDGIKSVVDNSAVFNFTSQGILGFFGLEDKLKTGFNSFKNTIDTYIDNQFKSYSDGLKDKINGCNGWVFPGNDAFLFKNLSFSDSLDLIAQLTYANPN